MSDSSAMYFVSNSRVILGALLKALKYSKMNSLIPRY